MRKSRSGMGQLSTKLSTLVKLYAVLAFFGSIVAHAQPVYSAGTVQIRQQVEYRYGDTVTFRMDATADFPIISARLKVESLSGRTIIDHQFELNGQTEATVEHVTSVPEMGIGAVAIFASQWEVSDASGATYLSDPAQTMYEDQTVAWDWKTLDDPKIAVHWDGKSGDLAARVRDISHASLERTKVMLGQLSDLPQIHIFVYRDLTAMAAGLRLHRQRVSDWVAAYSYPEDYIILVASDGGPEAIVALERDISHEIAHVVLHSDSNGTQVPGWFDEGVAILLSTENETPSDMMRQEISNGVLHSVESLCAPGFTGLPIQSVRLAYAQSASLVGYVKDRYGASQIAALAGAYRSGASCDAGVTQALGISLVQLEDQWHSELEARTLNTPSGGSAVPWAIIWLASLALAICLIMPAKTSSAAFDAALTRAGVEAVADHSRDS